MPHFDANGNDTAICQICGRIKPGNEVKWMPEITPSPNAGNVCRRCQQVHAATGKRGNELRAHVAESTATPISLHEHCHRESGLPRGSQALTNYINRYYGHG